MSKPIFFEIERINILIVNNILKQGKDIAQGHINEFLGLGKDLKEVRLEICHLCPIYSPKFGGLCNNNLWLNPETNLISTSHKDGYKRGCGCRLQAKTTLSYSVCPAGKW